MVASGPPRAGGRARRLAVANFEIAQLDEIPPVTCPCGSTRRAFIAPQDSPASMHVVQISEDARTHYHEKSTEIYLVQEGAGEIELDGQLFPVRPMTAVLIRPGCRHRAVGKMSLAIVCMPPFDTADEHFDDE